MNAIARTFADLKSRNRTALIPYLMAGFPNLARSLELIAAVSREADLLEIGVPFSDPIADGRSIQQAAQVSLQNRFRLRDFLSALAASPPACPTVLMSYLNPMLAYGRNDLLPDLSRLGISGLIIPDMPIEESDEWQAAAAAHGISLIHLVAPTSTDDRIRRAADSTDSFLYAVSVTGTTGARRSLDPGLPAYLGRIRGITGKPIAVGFGLSTPQHIRALRGLADGVIVGSRIIESIRNGECPVNLIRVLKDAARS